MRWIHFLEKNRDIDSQRERERKKEIDKKIERERKEKKLLSKSVYGQQPSRRGHSFDSQERGNQNKISEKNFSENSFLQKKICVNEVKKRFKVKLKLTCGEDELETSSINFGNLMPFKLLKDAF